MGAQRIGNNCHAAHTNEVDIWLDGGGLAGGGLRSMGAQQIGSSHHAAHANEVDIWPRLLPRHLERSMAALGLVWALP